jgi:hypothetical protein
MSFASGAIGDLELSQGKLELYFLALLEMLHAFCNLGVFMHQFAAFLIALHFMSNREMRFYKRYWEEAQL